MWWWAVAAAETGRLSDPVAPTKQSVHLVLDPEQSAYQGTVEIRLEVEEKLTSFHLHSEELTVREVSLSRGSQTISATATPVEMQMLKIEADRLLKPGEWVLKIAFEGELREPSEASGLYRVEHKGRHYIVSQFEANEARTAWPCFDEPLFKIPLSLSLDLPAEDADLLAVSNAKVRSDTADPSKKPASSGESVGSSSLRTITFEETKPISSYGWALAVGPYAAVDVPDMNVPTRILTLQGREGQSGPLLPELPSLMHWLERWFGEPYPYEKLDIIAIPEFAFGAMENPGAIVVNDFYLADETRSTAAKDASHRREMLHVMAHELGHMWFGNLVTLSWWDDFWLNESFAEWIGDRAVEGVYPELSAPILEAENAVRMLQSDGRSSARPIRTTIDPIAVFETVNFAVYDKGSALLDMTESWLGPEAFRAGVRRYLGNHRFHTATASDLFASLGIAAGKPVKDTLLPWLDRPGGPTIALDRLADGQIALEQRRYLLAGSAVEGAAHEPWPVVMKLRLGRPNGAIETRFVRITARRQTFDLGEVDWVLPTADGLGYFTFTLSPTLEPALLSALSSLSSVERMRVVAAVRLGFLAGTRSVQDLLRTLDAFSGESEPEVIRELLQTAQQLLDLARETEDKVAIEHAERWLAERARAWRIALGEPTDTEPALRRATREWLTAVLADAGDPETRAALRSLAQRFIEDPSASSVEEAALAIRVTAKDDAAFGGTLRSRAEAEEDPTLRRVLLSGAAWAGSFEQRRALLDWALLPEQHTPDLYAVWFTAMERREDRDQLAEWQMNNHDTLSAKIPEVHRGGLARIGAGCDPARVEKVRAFYLDPARAVAGTEQVLSEIEDEVRICRALMQIHGPSLTEALAALASR